MLTYLFDKILYLSLGAGIVILALWALCRFGGRWLTCRWRYYIWLLPAALLLLPVSLPQSFSVPASRPPAMGENIPAGEGQTAQTGPSASQTVPAQQTEGDNLQTVTAPVGETQAQPSPQRRMPAVPVLPLLWLAGIGALCLSHWFQGARFRRFLRRGTLPADPDTLALLKELQKELGVRRGVSLRKFPGRSSPFLYGVLCPVICLPDLGLSGEELRRVLAHELIHCRRRDLLVKRAVRAVRTLHWFNPLVWLLERQMNRYCELSCDEQVVRGLPKEERKSYGLTILKLMRQETVHPPQAAFLAEREIKNRLEVIMKQEQRGRLRRALSMTLAAVLCLGCTALAADVNGKNPNQNNGAAYQTTKFTEVWMSRMEVLPQEVRWGEAEMSENPGMGISYAVTGSAKLVDLPGNQSFSADVSVERLRESWYGKEYFSGPTRFEVEMTALHTAIKTAGTWTGLFTVRQNGAVVFENTPGRISGVPSMDGTRLTELFVVKSNGNWFRLEMDFGGAGADPTATIAAAQAARDAVQEAEDSQRYFLYYPNGGMVNGEEIQPTDEAGLIHDLFVNQRLGQAVLEMNTIAIDQPFETARPDGGTSNNTIKYYKIFLDPEDVISLENGVIRGTFRLEDSLYDRDHEFLGTLTILGLDGAQGRRGTLRSDDGLTSLDLRWSTGPAMIGSRAASGTGSWPLMPAETYQSLVKSSVVDMTRTIPLSDLPFALTWGQDGLHMRFTGPEGWHWKALFYNMAGYNWYTYDEEFQSKLTPFQGAYMTAKTDADAPGGTLALPWAGPEQDQYELYLAAYSTQTGASCAQYRVVLHKDAEGITPLSCELTYSLENREVTGDTALNLIKMYLDKWVFED